MRSICCLFFCAAACAVAQTKGQSPNGAAWETFYSKQANFRERGSKALEAENAREKSESCGKSQSTLEANKCLALEWEITEKNYKEYAIAIGGLLRLDAPDNTEPVQPPSLGKRFDQAELLWNRYKEAQCDVSSDQYFGGSIRPSIFLTCKQELTRRHMHELEDLYKGLWQ